ncbi:CYTH domain-containing protein [Sphingobium rhizovicinum]|uniref:CYTH domain-containing protein n=1 Tax=Sphingobium rhizovicinum TaxID=432308 RepID=A0ABV7NLT0_9SPHN
MPIEIERKFLVVGDGWRQSADGGRALRQGYIVREGKVSVRIRLAGDRGWITLKSARAGMVRDEFEYEIAAGEAADMLDRLCSGPVIEKTRYKVPHGGWLWDVDVFAGAAAGLVLAEVELDAADARVDLPDWVGREVTDDPRYRNSAIGLVAHNIEECDGA